MVVHQLKFAGESWQDKVAGIIIVIIIIIGIFIIMVKIIGIVFVNSIITITITNFLISIVNIIINSPS